MRRHILICQAFVLLLAAGLLLSGCRVKEPSESPSFPATQSQETTEQAPTESETEPTVETEKQRLFYKDVPADQILVILPYYPDDGSWPDDSMWDVVEPIMEKFGLERVYEAPTTCTVSTGRTLSDAEVMDLMTAIAEDDNVWVVHRDTTAYRGVRIDKAVTGPEPIPLGDWGDAAEGNPWVEYKTLAEAEEAVGFTFRIPESDLEKVYRTYEKSILEVIFVRDGKEVYRLRKGAGYGNISGYPNRELSGQTGVGGPGWVVPFTQVGRLQSEDQGVSGYRIAARYYREYSYSFTSAEGMSEAEMFLFFIDDKNQNEKANAELMQMINNEGK